MRPLRERGPHVRDELDRFGAEIEERRVEVTRDRSAELGDETGPLVVAVVLIELAGAPREDHEGEGASLRVVTPPSRHDVVESVPNVVVVVAPREQERGTVTEQGLARHELLDEG